MEAESSPAFRSDETPPEILKFTNVGSVFLSWFWRYYDHLGRLVFLNIIWFSVCPLPTWLCWHWFGSDLRGKIPIVLAAMGLWDCAVSIPVGYLVFLIFYTGSGSLRETGREILRFWPKAFGLFFAGTGITFLAIFNIRFYIARQENLGALGWILGGLVLWILFLWLSSMLYQWPLLFFQNTSILKIYYKSFLLTLDNYPALLLIWIYGAGCVFLFILVPVLWFFFGFVFIFSFQCMLLEKHLLKYKITYRQRALDDLLFFLEKEKKRSWREFLKPWEYR